MLRDRGIPLASNQVQYSLLHRDPEVNGVLDTCRELGATLIAYMPLASGALTDKYSAAHRPAGWRRYMPMFWGKGLIRLERVNEVLRDLAGQHGKTPSQVARDGSSSSTAAAHSRGEETADKPRTTSAHCPSCSPNRRWTP